MMVSRVDKNIIASSKGSLDFSGETEEAESHLFQLARGLLDKVGEGLSKDQLTFLQRCIKMALQASPYDLRGSRRASVLCDFIQVDSKPSNL